MRYRYPKLDELCRKRLGENFLDLNFIPTTTGWRVALLTKDKGFSYWEIPEDVLEKYDNKNINELWDYLEKGVENLIDKELQE